MRKAIRPASWLILSTLMVCGGYLCQPAAAVVIASGDGSGNTSAPADDPGWSYMGVRGGASAIYMGNDWVATTAHVGVGNGSVVFDGNTYQRDPDVCVIRLKNDNQTKTDIIMFKLESGPSLPPPEIPTTVTLPGSEVTMIGYGRNREPNMTTWDIDTGTNPDSWIEHPPDDSNLINRSGYKTGGGFATRWGENTVESVGLYIISVGPSGSYGKVRALSTKFDANGLTHEAQAVPGDSGGGVFYKDGNSWQLIGMIFAIDTFNDQSLNYAVFDNLTYAADLLFYRDQLLNPDMRLLGDMDESGSLNTDDINPLVLALADPNAYAQQYPDTDANWVGDVDEDGTFNSDDINPFVELLIASSVAAEGGAVVPEPATLLLLGIGVVLLLFRRRRKT